VADPLRDPPTSLLFGRSRTSPAARASVHRSFGWIGPGRGGLTRFLRCGEGAPGRCGIGCRPRALPGTPGNEQRWPGQEPPLTPASSLLASDQ